MASASRSTPLLLLLEVAAEHLALATAADASTAAEAAVNWQISEKEITPLAAITAAAAGSPMSGHEVRGGEAHRRL
jgi:hypothetical protein